MSPPERDVGRIPVVDYLRGLSALAIAWYHLTNTYTDGWAKVSGSYGWLGVEVFFVISGFVIPYSITRTYAQYNIADFFNFFLMRAIRLEPPYIASIALVIAAWHASALLPGFRGTTPTHSIDQLAAHFFYLVPVTKQAWLQPVYWSLAYEFAFYITVGLLFPIICTRSTWAPWIGVAAALSLSVTVGALPPRILLFVMGIAVFRRWELNDSPVSTIAVLLMSAAAMSLGGDKVSLFAGLAASAVLLWGITSKLPDPAGRAFLALGGMSYSLYLTHVPVGGRIVNFGRRFVEGWSQELILSIAALVTSLCFAFLFNRVIERRAILYARRLKSASGFATPTGR